MTVSFNSKVFLAPMAGITDRPMRKTVASYGNGIMFSEMVAINALNRKNPKTYRIADVRDEPYPVIVQLVGGDPELFGEAVRLVEELGAYSIDINMGCPVKKIVGNDSGAHLMKDIKLASSIIKEAVNATKLNISVKFRKGWDNNSINAVEFAKMCEDSGAGFISVHGRTRAQGYSGNADWDIIADVKNSVKIPVIGNGDVTTPELAKQMLKHTKADGVMIGRGVLGSPWLIADTHNYLENGTIAPTRTIAEIKQALLTHIKELEAYYGGKMATALSRKYVCWYCKNMFEASRFRNNYMRINDFAEALKTIDEYFDNQGVEA